MTDVRVAPAGDAAWLIELPDRLDPAVNARAIAIAGAVGRARLAGVTDIVVGFRTVMVHVDRFRDVPSDLDDRLRAIADTPVSVDVEQGPLVRVPACYDRPFALDLEDVAAFAKCSTDEVIVLHLSQEYRVYVVGFVPGFAYMARVDPRLALPRRTNPRLKVPAGSVAVAAGQTGVYPASTPGGWHVIGRIPIKPYDPARAEPFLFRPGCRVRFHRIDAEEYRRTSEWGDA
jgi:KipI family sensor histidine kinase inhibitor